MEGNFKEFNERSGPNYHEGEFKFDLVHSFKTHVSYFYGEYHSPCKKPPIELMFQVEFRNVIPGSSMACTTRVKRADFLFDAITMEFTLTISNSIGFVSPVITFLEDKFGFGQEINKNFSALLHHSTLGSMISEPLIISVQLRMIDCHEQEEPEDFSNIDKILGKFDKHQKI